MSFDPMCLGVVGYLIFHFKTDRRLKRGLEATWIHLVTLKDVSSGWGMTKSRITSAVPAWSSAVSTARNSPQPQIKQGAEIQPNNNPMQPKHVTLAREHGVRQSLQ